MRHSDVVAGHAHSGHGEDDAGVACEQKTWKSFDISKPKVDISKPKEKEKKNLAFACEDAMVCVPVGAVVFKVSQGPGGGEERRGEGKGKVSEEG